MTSLRENIDVLRLLPVAVFVIYGTIIAAEGEIASLIPLYIALPMLFLYFVLAPVSFVTALIRVAFTFLPYYGFALLFVGGSFIYQDYPDIFTFKALGHFFIGLSFAVVSLKFPAWAVNDT